METEGVMMRWGLVPASTKSALAGRGSPSVGSGAIEGSEENRTVWLYGQRCIIPLAGFYVWHRS